MGINPEDLGLTKEQLQERVIETIVDRLFTTSSSDEDGHEWPRSSEFKHKLDERIKERVDQAIDRQFKLSVGPKIDDFVENLVLEETNRWGEKKGTKLSFIEYLVQRADAYMKEPVNYEGKTQAENGGYSWTASGTRVANIVHRHLHYAIETAMKQALANANSSIVGGLEEAVKIQLGEIQKKLKVTVQTDR